MTKILKVKVARSNINLIKHSVITSVATKLKTLRYEKDLTLQKLAHITGLEKDTIFDYENAVTEPTVADLTILGACFDKKVDYFMPSGCQVRKMPGDYLQQLREGLSNTEGDRWNQYIF